MRRIYRIYLKSGNSFTCDETTMNNIKELFESAPLNTFIHAEDNELPSFGVLLSEIEAYVLECVLENKNLEIK